MYIRTRLALLLLLIVTAILIIFSFAIYLFMHSTLTDAISKDMRQRANMVATALRQTTETSQLSLPNLDTFSALDTYIQVQDQRGRVLASSTNLSNQTLPLLPGMMGGTQIDEGKVGNIHLYLYALPVQISNQQRDYVLVAHSNDTVNLALGLLTRFLYVGVPITLFLAGVGVWWLVYKALSPLEYVVATTADIAAVGDHSRRLRLQGPRDEIRHLSSTINMMLQSLEDAYREVREVNDLQRSFLIDVSHELRTPLTIMRSSLDLTQKMSSTDPTFQAYALSSMREEVDRMARMVTQLLFLARSDTAIQTVYEVVLLIDIITDACTQVSATDARKVLTCHNLEMLQDVVVWGHPDSLKQLFLILLDNAFKYIPEDGKVSIACSLSQDTASITIADNGVGIVADELPKIFERFYRGKNSHSQTGTGLGLAIARRICEQHGAEIGVESELGQGSRFTVTFACLDCIYPKSPNC